MRDEGFLSAFSLIMLSAHLTTLEASGLVRLAQVEPELEYLFRHALIQDAAYSSLLKADRKKLHRTIGEVLEQLFPDQLAELAPRLAEHFSVAGEEARALHYFTLAGDEAAHVYANAEAVAHYTRALELAKRAPPSPAARLQALYLGLGRVLELLGHYDRALATYTEMGELAQARNEPQLELAALVELAKLRALPGGAYDPPQGRVLAEKTLALARALGDQAAEARILWILSLLNIYGGGALPEAAAYGDQALALTRTLDLRELRAFILNDVWGAHLSTGDLARAWAMLTEAHQLWQELGNIPMLATNHAYRSLMHLWVGELEQAIQQADKGFRLAGSVGNTEGQVMSYRMIFIMHAESGHFGQGLVLQEQVFERSARFGLGMIQIEGQAEVGWAYGQLGAVEHGLELARLAETVAVEKAPHMRSYSRLVLARLHLLRGEMEQARAALSIVEDYARLKHTFGLILPYWVGAALTQGELALASGDYTQAIAIAEDVYAELQRWGVRLYRPDLLLLQSRALLALSRTEEAHRILTIARAEAAAFNSRRTLWRILAALGVLEAQRGHAAEAEALRAESRGIIDFIADHCPPDLRESFLNLPTVKKLIG